MSARKSRQAKSAVLSAPTPAAPSGSSQQLEDDVAMATSSHSPRMGRKEAEHKRRMVENQYYDELTTLLSMMSERSVLKKMDKVTTLKETVICVKVYYDLAQRLAEMTTPQGGGAGALSAQDKPVRSPPSMKSPSSFSSSSPCSAAPGGAELPPGLLDSGEMLSFFLDAHDSFLMIVSNTGRILFTSELVTSLLGQMQTRLVGQNIFDYIHPRHKSTIQELFLVPEGAKGKPIPNSPLIGYPSRSFSAHFKLYCSETEHKAQYLPFVCLSFLRQWTETSSLNSSASSGEDSECHRACTVIIGKLPTSMAMVDLAISTNEVNFEFDMRISQKGHIIDIDKHAVMVFGFSTAELIGTLFFEYVDPYHISEVGDSMSKFLSEGIGTTTPYRVRTKGGRCIWLISKGYLSYNPWNNKLNHILLANRVLGCDHVLPEHRFFENAKHLPDQKGEEAYYTPDSDSLVDQTQQQQQQVAATTAGPSSVNQHNSLSVIRPLPATTVTNHADFSGALAGDHAHNNHAPHSVMMERETSNSFPHLSTGVAGTSILEGTLDTAFNVFSEGAARGVASSVGEVMTRPFPQPSPSPSTQPRNATEPPPTSGAVGRGGMASSAGNQEQMQRELEEKSLHLLEMQRRLMEQEEQFNKDRMQFFRAAQKMMQQLSQGVGAGGGGGAGGGEGGDILTAFAPPQTSSSYGEPNAILESMCKPSPGGGNMVGQQSPMLAAMSGSKPPGGGGWGGVASPASSYQQQQQQQQQRHGNMQHGNMQHHGNMSQQQQQHGSMQPHHGNIISQQHGNISQQRQLDNRSVFLNPPPSASPSFQQHSSPQPPQAFAPQDFPSHTPPPSSFTPTHSNSLFGQNSLNDGPLFPAPTSQADGKFQSPLSCLPYDRNQQHQSLDEHNMQFLQQQQQQTRPDSLYMAGSRLMIGGSLGNSTPGAGSSLLSSPARVEGGGGGGSGGGGVGGRREGPQFSQNMMADLNDILSTTSSFNT